jgi:predicted small metal-binding protein
VNELRSLRCPCGFEVRSRSEDEIITMAQLHARTAHGQEITAEQARALIERVAA